MNLGLIIFNCKKIAFLIFLLFVTVSLSFGQVQLNASNEECKTIINVSVGNTAENGYYYLKFSEQVNVLSEIVSGQYASLYFSSNRTDQIIIQNNGPMPFNATFEISLISTNDSALVDFTFIKYAMPEINLKNLKFKTQNSFTNFKNATWYNEMGFSLKNYFDNIVFEMDDEEELICVYEMDTIKEYYNGLWTYDQVVYDNQNDVEMNMTKIIHYRYSSSDTIVYCFDNPVFPIQLNLELDTGDLITVNERYKELSLSYDESNEIHSPRYKKMFYTCIENIDSSNVFPILRTPSKMTFDLETEPVQGDSLYRMYLIFENGIGGGFVSLDFTFDFDTNTVHNINFTQLFNSIYSYNVYQDKQMRYISYSGNYMATTKDTLGYLEFVFDENRPIHVSDIFKYGGSYSVLFNGTSVSVDTKNLELSPSDIMNIYCGNTTYLNVASVVGKNIRMGQNPVNENIKFYYENFPTNYGPCIISVFNSTSTNLLTINSNIFNGNGQFEIDSGNLKNGFYMIVVRGQNGDVIFKNKFLLIK